MGGADDRSIICPICQFPLEEGDRQECSECRLLYHKDCWQENFGCAAYGCRMVNCLKDGPDLRIEPGKRRCPQCGFEQPESRTECLRCGIIFKKYEEYWARCQHDAKGTMEGPAEGIPRDYIYLGISVLGALMSLFYYGIPSLFLLFVNARFIVLRGRNHSYVILAISVLLCLVFACLGYFSSVTLHSE